MSVSEPSAEFIFREDDANVSLDDISDFVALYLATFNDEDEREDPAEWISRIRRKPPAPQPVTHILRVYSAAGLLAGGVVFEYYRSSGCALITYLVVSPDFRRLGIGRALVNKAIAISRRDAAAANGRLLAVFAESEDPTKFVSTFGPMPPRERIRAFSRLGAKWLRFPYVQPALAQDSQRVRHLLLLAFPLENALAQFIDGGIVIAFLHEFFRALGIAEPGKDDDFCDMTAFLSRPVVLNDLSHFTLMPLSAERPALSLQSCSVCLHLLEKVPALNNPADPLDFLYCPVTSSMELDLLSHAFRNPPVCNSECISSAHWPIEIHFPASYIYQTEGRVIEQLCKNTVLKARLGISRTTFARSGRVIWHMALIPDEDEAFSEYDIIKLIHLYDGKSEQTGLYCLIHFTLAGDPTLLSLDALLARLTGCGDTAIMAGTVQILNGDESEGEYKDAALLRMIRLSREADGEQYHDQLLALMKQEGNECRILKAYCGIVTGIFDFEEIDSEEALDTLEPTFADNHSYIRLQRSTLVSISAEDRALEALWDSVGASPYLFLPHAVLIHNESVVMDAEREIDRALRSLIRNRSGITRWFRRKPFGSLVDLERSRHFAERNLSNFLPNIFNYVTEREMLQRGAEGRGLMERLSAAQTRLQDLSSNIDSIWHIRREIGQMLIALLLMLMSVLQVKGSFEEELQSLSAGGQIVLFIVTTAVSGSAILWLWLRGLRKSPAQNEP